MRTHLITLLLLSTALAAVAAPAPTLPPLRVEGDRVLAGGQPIILRGINWGWWKLSGTRYTEEEMRNLAAWGGNLARLAFYYDTLEDDAKPGVWKEDGFRELDEVVQWGRRYGVYVILDMHNIPGGQNPSQHTVEGRNRFWSEPESQERFIALWREIARRYRNRPEVAAYELMNEPDTKNRITPNALRALNRRVIQAIREVDAAKIIVLSGDHYSGAKQLTDAVKVPEGNILYTFHFYDPGRLTHQRPGPGLGYPTEMTVGSKWFRNFKDGPGIAGTRDWVRIEEQFTPPAEAAEFDLMLRSSANSGSAWFDEVRLEREDGTVIYEESFDRNPGMFHPERPPHSAMRYDGATGHLKPGSVQVQATPDYNGWSGPRFAVEPGVRYRLSAWVKLEQATGDTYLTAAYYSGERRRIDREYLREEMAPAIAFARKHRVPIWAGEFGCSASARPEGSQTRWTRDCIALFEEAGIHWTYWNYKETTSPGSMALLPLNRERNTHVLNEELLAVLREGWARNARRP